MKNQSDVPFIRTGATNNLADTPDPDPHLIADDEEGEFIPLVDRIDIPPKTDKNNGFVLIGNTWQPKALYEARLWQRQQMVRKAESGVIWTR